MLSHSSLQGHLIGSVDAQAGEIAGITSVEEREDAKRQVGSGIKDDDWDGHRAKRLKVGNTGTTSIKDFEDSRFGDELGNTHLSRKH